MIKDLLCPEIPKELENTKVELLNKFLYNTSGFWWRSKKSNIFHETPKKKWANTYTLPHVPSPRENIQNRNFDENKNSINWRVSLLKVCLTAHSQLFIKTDHLKEEKEWSITSFKSPIFPLQNQLDISYNCTPSVLKFV